MDNNAKSCVSILIAKPGHCWHNFRRGFLPNDCHPEYLHENEYTHTFAEARALGQKMRDDAVAAYVKKYNQKPQFDENKIFWEASINAREYHTLDDLRKIGKIIEQKTGYRMIYGAIHRDEGHLNEEGQFVKNTHFQILYISLDENGNSMHRITRGKRQLMRDIQTEVAKALGMERGIDKRISGREHLTPRQYKQAIKIAEPIKQELKLTKADLKTAKERIKQLEGQLKTANLDARNELKAQGASRPDYAKLEAENAKLKDELAAFKKTTDNVSVDDFVRLFEEKIKKLRNHPKIDVEVEKTIKANNLRSGILGAFDKNSIMAYIADSVAIKHAAQSVIKEAQATLKKVVTKKEIDVYEQLKALRENKIAGALFGAASKPDVDVDDLKKENASLLKTFDVLQKQNKDLQAALKKATDLINPKNTGLEKPQKNQEVVTTQLDDSFFRGQAMLLSQLIREKQLYIEPKGRYLVESLNDIVSGETPFSSFEGIKSGLLSHCPSLSSPKNDLEI